jgi:hypothetical protein
MRFDEFHSKRRSDPIGEEHDELTDRVIGAAVEVHRVLARIPRKR